MRGGAGLLAGRPSTALRVLTDRWGTPAGPWTAAEFELESLPEGRTGEIVVSGGHVLAGYLDGEGDHETKIRVGDRVWHRTGDAGYIDGHGRLWLLGRCAARVSDANGDVYPFAVECAASGVAGVQRTAFVLHHDRRVLVAELEGPQVPETARAALLECTAWAHVAHVLVVARIPVDKRHNAKVDYPALRAMLDQLEPAQD
jgi:acyl-CoA synthetase (AMP-forming)/AMP-acid ligase II